LTALEIIVLDDQYIRFLFSLKRKYFDTCDKRSFVLKLRGQWSITLACQSISY